MAMLASKSPFPAPLATSGSGMMAGTAQASYPPSRRAPAVPPASQSFSPTESEFSDSDDHDSPKHWDEDKVCEYLRSVRCGEYEKLFRKNHINGENLLEMDKDVLKEMGIEKVGDRVRLFLSIKKLRTKAIAGQKKRNRDSFAGHESMYTPVSESPSKPFHSSSRVMPNPSVNKRYSRQIDLSGMAYDPSRPTTSSRPTSPLPSADFRTARTRNPYVGQQPTPTGSLRGLGSPPDSQANSRPVLTHTRTDSGMDGSLMAALPQNQDVIRVISTGGVTKVVKIADCNTCEEVMRVTLRKFALREDHERNYCFWVLSGLDPDPKQCRRLGDTELWRVIKDQKRPERNRLILRRVPAGEPGQSELERAAAIAMEEAQQSHSRAMDNVGARSQIKVQKVLGENWDNLQPPLSPVLYQDRERNVYNAARDLERPEPLDSGRLQPRRKVLRSFGGLRPPSELIASDLTTYFPDHPREDIDRTARLSMRRSARLSKVNSRLSVASSFSMASSIQDAPPIPTIADSWLQSTPLPKARPRDLQSRLQHGYRDSVASSMLDTLQEEGSPIEPNRKSYVSFADSGSDSAAVSVTDPDGNIVRHSYFDEGSTIGSGSGSGSFGDVSKALNEDGEDADEDLQSFLSGESWDDSKWMKGALIGQGSFGCVYLALHAITGELLAVKQVEAPSPGANSQNDARKKSMIEALKREISLLRDLRHPNIVQYLGCGSSAEYLNIFLEYVPGGSVQTMLNSYGALPEPLVRSFVRQILNGLSYLHEREIIHRDIKGANILVDNKGTIKISDFGISKKIEATNLLNGANNNKHRPSLQGSVFWMAPEVVKQTSYTRKADIWSLGCLVVEMMTGTHPFPDCTQLQAIFKIGGGKATPTIPEDASTEAKAFLAQTFEMDHNKRPSADDLMLSPFLTPIT
ncbi:STE/STE11 protein kinase [Pyricularia oryzae 70-15]|uniref:Mitogen-activated protein kinase kinae kinase MST11 n=3 Tax=Pyricularia oryzae TaxID=318829 RepID=MST11_PYRO7|nr:STE/STE11 protein kinase [Pyricularia oryzae 70-15]G4N7X0.1 RecName: Full=Mitogen-activated protein kinase kinae kinase MST11; Short=MAPKKK MST11; AltName: Full=MEKK MST11 [Pyricularia oryzae 70-15]ELQ44197.1 sporulation-specific protein 1 [Pyricularia oryzae Y34]KAI7925789.1 STE/STE11 protein kinase [Pyricularia oryzae]EHA50924.1 STE/STE11 protein kinase [Pyricularia oryzae 70-15]KAI7927120.1 STE/STE11 protein kinase [Pyricularia oryzae]